MSMPLTEIHKKLAKLEKSIQDFERFELRRDVDIQYFNQQLDKETQPIFELGKVCLELLNKKHVLTYSSAGKPEQEFTSDIANVIDLNQRFKNYYEKLESSCKSLHSQIDRVRKGDPSFGRTSASEAEGIRQQWKMIYKQAEELKQLRDKLIKEMNKARFNAENTLIPSIFMQVLMSATRSERVKEFGKTKITVAKQHIMNQYGRLFDHLVDTFKQRDMHLSLDEKYQKKQIQEFVKSSLDEILNNKKSYPGLASQAENLYPKLQNSIERRARPRP